MLEKMFRTLCFAVLTMALTSSILLTGLGSSNAATPGFTPPDNYRQEDSGGVVFEPSEENNEKDVPKDQINMDEIFGSEQVFPFEMGLGN